MHCTELTSCNSKLCSLKRVVINRALTHTHHTQPNKGHTHSHTAKKRSHSPIPTHSQPYKGHTHPHPPTSTHKKVIPTHTHPYPDKKRSDQPTAFHTQLKKGHTHQNPAINLWKRKFFIIH